MKARHDVLAMTSSSRKKSRSAAAPRLPPRAKARLPGYRASAQETARALEIRAPAAVHRDAVRANGRVTFASAVAIAFPIATSMLMLAARIFGLGG